MSYEIKDGLYIYVNNEPVVFPRDINYTPVSVMYAMTENSKFPIPIQTTVDGKLRIDVDEITAQIGAVEIEQTSTGRKLNLVLPNDNAINLTGILFYGIDQNNKVKPFLFDLNNKLLVSDTENNQLLNLIKDYLMNSLVSGTIERDLEGYVTSIITTNSVLNKSTKVTFTRNDAGEIVSWDEVVL